MKKSITEVWWGVHMHGLLLTTEKYIWSFTVQVQYHTHDTWLSGCLLKIPPSEFKCAIGKCRPDCRDQRDLFSGARIRTLTRQMKKNIHKIHKITISSWNNVVLNCEAGATLVANLYFHSGGKFFPTWFFVNSEACKTISVKLNLCLTEKTLAVLKEFSKRF